MRGRDNIQAFVEKHEKKKQSLEPLAARRAYASTLGPNPSKNWRLHHPRKYAWSSRWPISAFYEFLIFETKMRNFVYM